MTSRGSSLDRATEAETLIIREASQPKSVKVTDNTAEAQLNRDNFSAVGDRLVPILEVVKSYDFSRIRGQKFSIDELNRLKGVSNFKF